MNWYGKMYLSASVKDKAGQIMKEMEAGQFSKKVWVISIPIGEKDQLDIRRASSLAYHGLWESIPMIVGLAGSQKEAVGLIIQITGDCLKERGDALLRAYLCGDMYSAR